MESLPEGVLLSVLGRLEVPDLASAMCTCRRLHALRSRFGASNATGRIPGAWNAHRAARRLQATLLDGSWTDELYLAARARLQPVPMGDRSNPHSGLRNPPATAATTSMAAQQRGDRAASVGVSSAGASYPDIGPSNPDPELMSCPVAAVPPAVPPDIHFASFFTPSSTERACHMLVTDGHRIAMYDEQGVLYVIIFTGHFKGTRITITSFHTLLHYRRLTNLVYILSWDYLYCCPNTHIMARI